MYFVEMIQCCLEISLPFLLKVWIQMFKINNFKILRKERLFLLLKLSGKEKSKYFFLWFTKVPGLQHLFSQHKKRFDTYCSFRFYEVSKSKNLNLHRHRDPRNVFLCYITDWVTSRIDVSLLNKFKSQEIHL